MRIIQCLLLMLFLGPVTSKAQLRGVLNRAKSNAESRAERQADKAVDKALDKAEGKSNSGGSPAPTKETSSKSSETSGETIAKTGPTSASNAAPGLESYSKFDFIPGEKILYSEDFAQDEMGELPLGWNTGGKAELVTLNSIPGNWLRLYQNAVYLTSNKTPFTKNFTVEFDVIFQLKSNGYTYPYFSFGFFSSKDEATNANTFLKENDKYQSAEFVLRLSEGGSSHLMVKTREDRKSFFDSEIQNLSAIEKYYHKVSHIAIQVQETRTRIWVNGEKKFDLPMASPVAYIYNNLFFDVNSSSYKDDEIGFYINNLKVATGKPDARSKLIEEGKFSTTGILFDIQSAVIKPESYGVLKDIARVLKENASVRVKIIGHTSSDGDDNANLELSKKRSAAVKEILSSEFGIDGSRLETEGRGETQPVADNKSKEGKVLNRRVEFIKL